VPRETAYLALSCAVVESVITVAKTEALDVVADPSSVAARGGQAFVCGGEEVSR
jgi:hypothetical protein